MCAHIQMEYLLSHIEKLMNHLKHEASAKVKAYAAAAKYDNELESLRNKNAILAQRNATRERVITELKVWAPVVLLTVGILPRSTLPMVARPRGLALLLLHGSPSRSHWTAWSSPHVYLLRGVCHQEGARILEDQLRMMDEKYGELRANLDATRHNSKEEVKKVKTKADRLRMKWMALQSFGTVPKELMDSPDDLRETAGLK